MFHTKKPSLTLPPLPYKRHALEPYISARTLDFHYGKHHQGYADKFNKLVSGSDLTELTLEEVMLKTTGDDYREAILNNAAQVWNHTFYWNSLSPEGGGKPSGELGKKIEMSFSGYENLIKQFCEAGTARFGSGWVWLIKENGTLKIMNTLNAENPILLRRGTPLLTLDVWEHAYYLDYQNRRNDYLTTLLDKLINWEFAAKNFNQA
ncbi:MAG: superoxide dismutase [Fe] [Candidatus Omnitrophica bacterium CG11_big_fil_rev_8_21_14_0_20_45_26]|uniref:Superoxide dismutase n=1 Tax=Candidatus Abzuiibacterium crystallinum TaxID=1974748 RepID=A0A2H0LTW2_9BACT|nr:MAG: superoxide dismutase [Fe] [Candidatus Omnitrophica bacterium CG11_big_fil_rev_8_21_14_0_20_45_26]PIW64890.1 MAG: superoxide dismutase [Fe] [Candidatus Omnitrophica bacterium CG12_big_fil_rev_8_21_14_0_65_45_16]